MATQKKVTKDPDNSELDLQMPFMKLKMKHAKWPVLIVSIGIMFAIIIYAHSWYKRDQRSSLITKIAERFTEGETLTNEEVAVVESLSEGEREELVKRIEGFMKGDGMVPPPEPAPIRVTATAEDGSSLTVEQKVAPGTPVTVTRNGKNVEIRKGGPEPDPK